MPTPARPAARHTTLATFGRPALAAAFAAALGALATPAGAAPAQFDCYDFSGLAPDTEYTVGQTVNARHSTVTVKQYFTNGNPATADARRAKVVSSKIAGGAPPEMSLYLVSFELKPNQPISRMRVNIAQSISQTGGFANANIAVNGERHESPNGFAGMNGKTIGHPAKGRVAITSSLAPVGDSNWQAGMLELRATSGQIESILLGGHTWRVDNYCIAR
jgi:hypothetical protein